MRSIDYEQTESRYDWRRWLWRLPAGTDESGSQAQADQLTILTRDPEITRYDVPVITET